MTLATVSDLAFLAGRVLFDGVLAVMDLHHVLQTASLAADAASKGEPLPMAAVLGPGALLVLGGGDVLLGVRPVLAGRHSRGSCSPRRSCPTTSGASRTPRGGRPS